MGKYYHLLYQSLIPNCSLTIKVLRQHLSISHGVELYILNGASPRLRCQRLVNFLLVHLDDLKDYAQFCDHLNLVSVLNDLPNRLIAGMVSFVYIMYVCMQSQFFIYFVCGYSISVHLTFCHICLVIIKCSRKLFTFKAVPKFTYVRNYMFNNVCFYFEICF